MFEHFQEKPKGFLSNMPSCDHGEFGEEKTAD